jgi:alkanesulfonate monooxygenase SsuD/methylene tetrahydromethanopterin reductase-like flavin-dependent oxidoreductase (luciferase family)
VALDRSAGERPITPDAPPLEGSPERIAGTLRELADAGANEAILVVSPISERSIRQLGDVVALLRP